ncbi:MAG: hypothetical protein K940chlam6_01366 [Chlamydiae bacterium]|nr:hypothetical protein [Chlamydiota bacterium]
MFQKAIIIIFCIFSNLSLSSISYGKQIEQSTQELYCAPELRQVFSLLREMPDVNNLIDKILEGGPLYIEMNQHLSKKFEGYWSASDRTIYITKSRSPAALLTTILFEMHNAANDTQLQHIDSLAYQGKTNRKQYVRAVEYWEYKNAKATTAILNRGIECGIFPENSYWYISDDFEEHFRIQKSAGHSSHIGEMYDDVIRYG